MLGVQIIIKCTYYNITSINMSNYIQMPSWVMFEITNTEGHFIEHFYISVTTPVKIVRSCFCHSESKIRVIVA
jgi:hypothetical protein